LESLKSHPDWIIQGEVYGKGLQQNRLGVKDGYRFAVFNIWHKVELRRFGYEELVAACRELNLPMVEVIEEGEAFDFGIEQLLTKSRGYYAGTKNHREGLVVRPKVPTRTRRGEKLSFKVINNDYLVQTGQ
jgi:ATP-dependent RNA circularization protein (DNA/RNA ligase family)